MDLNQAIRDIIREELAGLQVGSSDPELISIEETCVLCGADKSVILALHHERQTNGFPSVQLGPRTIKVDKRRLNLWFANGGVGVKA